MTELQLLQELEKRFRIVINEKRKKRIAIYEKKTATQTELLCESATYRATADMYSVFSDFYEELGYSDEQVWQK